MRGRTNSFALDASSACPSGRMLNRGRAARVITGFVSLVATILVETVAAQLAPSLLHHTLDAGGGRSVSANYTLDSSLGGFGGTFTASPSTVARVGFAGQLDEPPTARPDLIERLAGTSGKMLAADLLANDDDTEGSALVLDNIAATSAGGVIITLDGTWLIYEGSLTAPAEDTFQYWIRDDFGNLEPGLVRVMIRPADGAQTLNILRIETLPNGMDRLLVFVGIPGRTYEVQATTNLSNPMWLTIGAATADNVGLYSFVDTNAHLFTSRFYRALQP